MKNKILAIILLFVCLSALAVNFGCQASTSSEINAVVKVEFSDSENPFTNTDDSLLEDAFLGGEDSLKNFIYKNSNGKVNVDSRILTTVKLTKPVDYFMPKYAYDYKENAYVLVNEIGYDNRYFDESGTPSVTGKQSVNRRAFWWRWGS